MSDHKETYLGDGLYASFDGYSVILRAPRDHGDHVVYLEPEVLAGFQRFLNRVLKPKE
jgi:hypothetical protein